jgi:hypothetical protein
VLTTSVWFRIVLAMEASSGGVPLGALAPYMFRSYEHWAARTKYLNEDRAVLNPGPALNVEIWQVVRAATAAPLYFSPQKIGGSSYLDIATSINNPAHVAFSEVSQLHEGPQSIALNMSIGCGSPGSTSRTTSVIDHAVGIFSDSEKRHEEMVRTSKTLNVPYERFNVGNGLANIDTRDWKSKTPVFSSSKPINETLERIKAATSAYLAVTEVKERLMAVARILVKERRERAKDSGSWNNAVAEVIMYRCPVEGCTNSEPEFADVSDLLGHLSSHHDLSAEPESGMDQLVKDATKVFYAD